MKFMNKTSEKEDAMMQYMNSSLMEIYKNRSGDEYKMHGDITSSPEYSTIEKMVSDLKTLKGFSKVEANDIRLLFLTLHRPVFKKLVTEFLVSPDERNYTFTTVYTVGYRLLVGELSRIYSSTEATEKGISYKPDKISRKENAKYLIKHFNNTLEKKIDDYIHEHDKKEKAVQEGAVVAASQVAGAVMSIIATAFEVVGLVFKGAKELNPISLVNALLTKSYDNKVRKFGEVSAMYNATKDAYAEYMKIPASKRSEKIESKYIQNMEKYNIKMQNLAAEIEHYDQRSIEESKEAKSKKKISPKPAKDETTVDDSEKTSSSESSGSGSSDKGGWDF